MPSCLHNKRIFKVINNCNKLSDWLAIHKSPKNPYQKYINAYNKYCIVLDEYIPKLHKLQLKFNTNFKIINSQIHNTKQSTNPENISLHINNYTQLIQDAQRNIDTITEHLQSLYDTELEHINTYKPLNRISRIRLLSLNFQITTTLINKRLSLHNQFIINKLANLRRHETDNIIITELANKSPNFHNFTTIHIPIRIQKIINKGPSFIPTNPSEDPDTCHVELYKSILLSLKKLANKNILHSIFHNSTPTPFNNFKLHKKSQLNKLNTLLSHPRIYKNTFEYIHATLNEFTNIPQDKLMKTNPTLFHNVTIEDIKSIQTLAKNNDIIIRISDKNMGLCINNTSWYINEYYRQINCNTYSSLGKFDTHSIDNLINSAKNDLIHLFSSNHLPRCAKSDTIVISDFIKSKNIKLPSMDILPKVHKLINPPSPSNEHLLKGRPIITAHSWITSPISKALGFYLNILISRFEDKFLELNFTWPIINSSCQLIDQIKDIDINYFDDISIITFDFENLYTNISHETILDTLFKITSICDYDHTYFKYFIQLYNFTCKYSNFSIGKHLFKQNTGVQMGSYHRHKLPTLFLHIANIPFLDIFITFNPSFC